MSYERLAYDDPDTTVKMHTDCDAATSEMGIPQQAVAFKQFSTLAADTAAIDRTSEITVSDAMAEFGSKHLD